MNADDGYRDSGISSAGRPPAGARRLRHALALLVAGAAVAGCNRRNQPRPIVVRTLRLTTGTPGAGFYPLGEALAAAYRSALPDLEVSVSKSPGSVHNVEALQNGDADMGFAFADVAYVAFVGRLDGQQPFDRLRGIAVLPLNPLHLVVGGQSNIRTVADLRGRRVGFGPPGSGTALTASLVLRAFGIDPATVHAELLPFNEASAQIRSGRLDAMFVNASYPSASVAETARSGARLLPIEGPPVDRLRHDYPFLRLTSIPAGTYPLHSVAVHTVGVDNLLLCRRDLDDDLVYELTKQFFAVLPALAAAQTSLRQMDFAQAPATAVPLHEGAARYYRERELFR